MTQTGDMAGRNELTTPERIGTTEWRAIKGRDVPLAIPFLEFLNTDGTITKGESYKGGWHVPEFATHYRYSYVDYPAAAMRPPVTDGMQGEGMGEVKAAPGWEDIDTAPKCGREIETSNELGLDVSHWVKWDDGTGEWSTRNGNGLPLLWNTNPKPDLHLKPSRYATHPQPSASADALECAREYTKGYGYSTDEHKEHEVLRLAAIIQATIDAAVARKVEQNMQLIRDKTELVNSNTTLTARNAELVEALGKMQKVLVLKPLSDRPHPTWINADGKGWFNPMPAVRYILASQGDGNGGRGNG